jgi:hypothetical protein
MAVQGGVLLQQDKYILRNYGIRDAKGHLWVWNNKLVMWGHQDMRAPFHILHDDHRPCPQLRMLGMFHHPNPRYK